MKKSIVVLYGFMMMLFVSTVSYADIYDEATIVSINESYRMVRVNERVCANSEVVHPAPTPQAKSTEKSYVGPVLGGVVGGVVGSQIGRGKANTAATIAGAVGGTLLGDYLGNPKTPEANAPPPAQSAERCRNVERDVSQHDGYDVTYTYAGKTEMIHMLRNPGYSGKIRVRITPLFAEQQ